MGSRVGIRSTIRIRSGSVLPRRPEDHVYRRCGRRAVLRLQDSPSGVMEMETALIVRVGGTLMAAINTQASISAPRSAPPLLP